MKQLYYSTNLSILGPITSVSNGSLPALSYRGRKRYEYWSVIDWFIRHQIKINRDIICKYRKDLFKERVTLDSLALRKVCR